MNQEEIADLIDLLKEELEQPGDLEIVLAREDAANIMKALQEKLQ